MLAIHIILPSSSLFLVQTNTHPSLILLLAWLLYFYYFFFSQVGLGRDSIAFLFSAMKLAKIMPTKFFKSYKKSRSVTRSETDPLSFSSQTTSSSCSDDGFKKPNGLSTPTSVLPSTSTEILTDEWSEISTDVYFELKQAFEMIDRDGDGKIKKEELEALLCRIGAEPPSQEELKMMLSEVDRDGDGCISLEEFYAIGSAFAPPTCDSELRDAFDFFDSDRDGKITAEELFSVFKTIGDPRCTLEDCRRMIKGVNSNGDGFVCFEDFSRMMEQQR